VLHFCFFRLCEKVTQHGEKHETDASLTCFPPEPLRKVATWGDRCAPAYHLLERHFCKHRGPAPPGGAVAALVSAEAPLTVRTERSRGRAAHLTVRLAPPGGTVPALASSDAPPDSAYRAPTGRAASDRERPQATADDRKRARTIASERGRSQATADDRKRARAIADDRKRARAIANDRKRPQATASDRKRPQPTASDRRRSQASASDWNYLSHAKTLNCHLHVKTGTASYTPKL